MTAITRQVISFSFGLDIFMAPRRPFRL